MRYPVKKFDQNITVIFGGLQKTSNGVNGHWIR